MVLPPNWIKFAAAGAAVLVVTFLLSAVVSYVRGSEAAKASIPVLRAQVEQARSQARLNKASFDACFEVNEFNAQAAKRQREKIEQALAEVEHLRKSADTVIEETNDEAEQFRSRGLECPALDDDFRQWVLNNP